jgi:hypothetical protein
MTYLNRANAQGVLAYSKLEIDFLMIAGPSTTGTAG